LAQRIVGVLELDEILHLLVESSDLQVNLGAKVWHSAGFDIFDDINIGLNA